MNWKNNGFTQVPNIIINNPAIPRCARSTYDALSSRAFGKKAQVIISEAVLAKDVGVTRMTISRHLKVLERLHLIRRIRRGEGKPNVIVLTLKSRMNEAKSLALSIQSEINGLSGYVVNRKKLTMKQALKLGVKDVKTRGNPMDEKMRRLWKELQRPHSETVKSITACVCPECKKVYNGYIEIGHIQSPEAWRIGGNIVKVCSECCNRVVRVPLHV